MERLLTAGQLVSLPTSCELALDWCKLCMHINIVST